MTRKLYKHTFPPSTGGVPFQIDSYTSGSNTWTKPAGVQFIEVWLTGGGGGGGRGEPNWNCSGGGQSGATMYGKITAAQLTAGSYTIAIGSGGAGANSGTAGGGNATSSTGFGWTADGGQGGDHATQTPRQNDGATCNNDNSVSSTPLQIRGGQTNRSGGGNSNDDPAPGTYGGPSYWGGGGNGGARNCASSEHRGGVGQAWGSGGGAGADREGLCNGDGAAGANGCCLIISYK